MDDVERSVGSAASWCAAGACESVGIWFSGFRVSAPSCPMGHCARGAEEDAVALSCGTGHWAGLSC